MQVRAVGKIGQGFRRGNRGQENAFIARTRIAAYGVGDSEDRRRSGLFLEEQPARSRLALLRAGASLSPTSASPPLAQNLGKISASFLDKGA